MKIPREYDLPVYFILEIDWSEYDGDVTLQIRDTTDNDLGLHKQNESNWIYIAKNLC